MNSLRYYHHDRRGDTVTLTDGTGTVTDRASYGVYGELLSRTGTTNTPFLFNGKWGVQTDASGIYYHRARYYHPELRRFLNQDTVLGSIGTHAGMNRFAYTNGNPVTGIDPFGLASQDIGQLTKQTAVITTRVNATLSDLNSIEANVRTAALIGMSYEVLDKGIEVGAASAKGVTVIQDLAVAGGYLTSGVGGRVIQGMPGTKAGDLINSMIGSNQIVGTGHVIYNESLSYLSGVLVVAGLSNISDLFNDLQDGGLGTLSDTMRMASIVERSYFADMRRLRELQRQIHLLKALSANDSNRCPPNTKR